MSRSTWPKDSPCTYPFAASFSQGVYVLGGIARAEQQHHGRSSDDDQLDAGLAGLESIGQKTERFYDDLSRQCVHAMMVALRSDAPDATSPMHASARRRNNLVPAAS